MSDSRSGWLSGWGGVITGVGTIFLGVVAYLTYTHPHTALGQQSFSVRMNDGRALGESAGEDRGSSRDTLIHFEVKKCLIEPKLVP